MKNLLLAFILLVLAQLKSNAQVATTHQPDTSWFTITYALQKNKLPSKNALLTMKQQAIPENLQDSLRKYDWIDAGGYMYIDKKFTVNFGIRPTQYTIWRLGEKDTVLNFLYVNAASGGEMQHTNFFLANNPVYCAKKVNGQWWIELAYGYGSKEYLKVISFSNGVLVVDTPVNGKTTDKKMFSRMVHLAREKTFEWNKIEK